MFHIMQIYFRVLGQKYQVDQRFLSYSQAFNIAKGFDWLTMKVTALCASSYLSLSLEEVGPKISRPLYSPNM